MFGAFESEFNNNDDDRALPTASKTNPNNVKLAPPSRNPHGLVGLLNQGSTCYMNSVIQSVYMNPLFRDKLYKISPQSLGIEFYNPSKDEEDKLSKKELIDKKPWACTTCTCENKGSNDKCELCDSERPPILLDEEDEVEEKSGVKKLKPRSVPLELQKIFTRLQKNEVNSLSTLELTRDGFQWKNNSRQQHDVQELNRMFLEWIFLSLKGTTGSTYVDTIFKGVYVNQIICSVCNNVSENLDNFRDLLISVQDCPDLHSSLLNFIHFEDMNGDNKYECTNCVEKLGLKKVDAKRGSSLRSLPPILNFSLRRFVYDLKSLTRLKVNSEFRFPLVLDMKCYMEGSDKKNAKHIWIEDLYEKDTLEFAQKLSASFSTAALIYDLCGVVIHKGSAHSGHYHVLLRDVMGEGKWVCPKRQLKERKKVTLIKNKESSSSTSTPMDPETLLASLLQSCSIHNEKGMHFAMVDELSRLLSTNMNSSWAAMYKQKYGPIAKFLASCPNTFLLNKNQVFLLKGVDKKDVSISLESLKINSTILEEKKDEDTEEKERVNEETELSKEWGFWFDFNDSIITPVTLHDITLQYGEDKNNSNAYMLIYQRRDVIDKYKKSETLLPPAFWNEMVEKENEVLREKKIEYELWLNTINISVFDPFAFQIDEYGYLEFKKDVLTKGDLHAACVRDFSIDCRQDMDSVISHVTSTFTSLPLSPSIKIPSLTQSNISFYQIKPFDGLSRYHIHEKITTMSSLLKEQNICLLAWDEDENTILNLNKVKILKGSLCFPMVFNFLHLHKDSSLNKDLNITISKSSSIVDLFSILSKMTDIETDDILLHFINEKSELHEVEEGENLVTTLNSKNSYLIEDQSKLEIPKKGERVSLAELEVNKREGFVRIFVKDNVSDVKGAVYEVEIGKDASILELKLKASFICGIPEDKVIRIRTLQVESNCGVLIEDDALLSSINYRDYSLEIGTPILPNQMCLLYSMVNGNSTTPLGGGGVKSDMKEIIVDKNLTFTFLRQVIADAESQKIDSYEKKRFRKVEFSQGAIISNENKTLTESNFLSGDQLLFEDGEIPKSGNIKVQVYFKINQEHIVKKSEEVEGRKKGEEEVEVEDEEEEREDDEEKGKEKRKEDEDKGKEGEKSVNIKAASVGSKEYSAECRNRKKGLHEIGEIETSFNVTLAQFKKDILDKSVVVDVISNTSSLRYPISTNTVRISELNMNFSRAKVIRGDDKSLKKAGIINAKTYIVEILDKEENLNDFDLILNVARRIKNEEKGEGPKFITLPFQEVVVSMGRGVTLNDIRNVITRKFEIEDEKTIKMALLHKVSEWMKLDVKEVSKKPKDKKGKAAVLGRPNLASAAPYFIKDHSMIVFKQVSIDEVDTDDFYRPIDSFLKSKKNSSTVPKRGGILSKGLQMKQVTRIEHDIVSPDLDF